MATKTTNKTTATKTTPKTAEQLKAENMSKQVTPIQKPVTKKASGKKLSDIAQEQANAPSKAEQKATQKAEALQTKRADRQTEFVTMLNDSDVIIKKGLYDATVLPRIKAETDNQVALDEINAEIKKLNEARRNYASDAKRQEKRDELQTELNTLSEFVDAETTKKIAETSDNKTAIELLQGAIKTAKNVQASQAQDKFNAEIETLFHEEQGESIEALQLVGNDGLSVEKYEVGLKAKIENFANNIQAVDANGKPLVTGKALLDILNISEIDKRVRFIQEGLAGMEIKRRISAKRQAEGLTGDGFVETLKRMYEKGELQGHYVTLQKNTNVVEKFYKYLVGVDVEMVLPREHYVTLLTWSKEKTESELDEFFTNAPVQNDGKAISLNDVKAMATASKADVSLDSASGEEVVKDEKIIIKLSTASYGDVIPKMLAKYGSAQAFFEEMLQAEFIAVDARKVDSGLSQDEIDEALADFDETATETVEETIETASGELSQDEIDEALTAFDEETTTETATETVEELTVEVDEETDFDNFD